MRKILLMKTGPDEYIGEIKPNWARQGSIIY